MSPVLVVTKKSVARHASACLNGNYEYVGGGDSDLIERGIFPQDVTCYHSRILSHICLGPELLVWSWKRTHFLSSSQDHVTLGTRNLLSVALFAFY
jgi:hypothetical protein